MGYAGGDANLRRYVGNAPTSYVDPDGLQKIPSSVTERRHPRGDGLTGTLITEPIWPPRDLKPKMIDEFGLLDPTKLPYARPRHPGGTIGVGAGNNITITNPPPGRLEQFAF